MSAAPYAGLSGVRVAVTRPARPNDPLSEQLRTAGATVREVPLVRIAPPADPAPLEHAAARLGEYDWLVFTSATAVEALYRAAGPDSTGEALPRVAAVGPATAQAVVRRFQRNADVVPREFSGAALAAAMDPIRPLASARVLWPRAEDARPELPNDLQRAGALLDAPIAYRTLPDEDGMRRLAAMIRAGEVDVVTLTSPSAAVSLSATGADVGSIRIAVIGNTTAVSARELGLPVHIVAAENTIDALAAAVVADVRAQRGRSG